jgi:hypothetical protein
VTADWVAVCNERDEAMAIGDVISNQICHKIVQLDAAEKVANEANEAKRLAVYWKDCNATNYRSWLTACKLRDDAQKECRRQSEQLRQERATLRWKDERIEWEQRQRGECWADLEEARTVARQCFLLACRFVSPSCDDYAELMGYDQKHDWLKGP